MDVTNQKTHVVWLEANRRREAEVFYVMVQTTTLRYEVHPMYLENADILPGGMAHAEVAEVLCVGSMAKLPTVCWCMGDGVARSLALCPLI